MNMESTSYSLADLRVEASALARTVNGRVRSWRIVVTNRGASLVVKAYARGVLHTLAVAL